MIPGLIHVFDAVVDADCCQIMARNGCGKSTLMTLLCSELGPRDSFSSRRGAGSGLISPWGLVVRIYDIYIYKEPAKNAVKKSFKGLQRSKVEKDDPCRSAACRAGCTLLVPCLA